MITTKPKNTTGDHDYIPLMIFNIFTSYIGMFEDSNFHLLSKQRQILEHCIMYQSSIVMR